MRRKTSWKQGGVGGRHREIRGRNREKIDSGSDSRQWGNDA